MSVRQRMFMLYKFNKKSLKKVLTFLNQLGIIKYVVKTGVRIANDSYINTNFIK